MTDRRVDSYRGIVHEIQATPGSTHNRRYLMHCSALQRLGFVVIFNDAVPTSLQRWSGLTVILIGSPHSYVTCIYRQCVISAGSIEYMAQLFV